ncbi:MAG: hypothetical protein FJ125_12000 [Deltaproteobacteria bacterium]|nr:hypothetical protein [Deltaproteobacteria bacterium]
MLRFFSMLLALAISSFPLSRSALAEPQKARAIPPGEQLLLASLEGAVKVGQPERLPTLLLEGLSQIAREEGWMARSCADALEAMVRAAPEERMRAVVERWSECKAVCPPDPALLAKLAGLGEAQQAEKLFEACDKAGAEPAWLASLSKGRKALGWLRYMVYRHALTLLHRRLIVDRSDEQARALWDRFEKLIPQLATALLAPTEDRDR